MTTRFLFLVLVASPALVIPARAAAPVDYTRDIKPILRNKCSSCHGALKQASKLRLDAGRFIHAGKVVLPGQPDQSELIARVSSKEDALRMPVEGAPLTDDQIALLRAWIEQGAKYPDDEPVIQGPDKHWAFQPIGRPGVPAVRDASWPVNAVDHFVLAKLEARGWRPNPSADPRRLIRRAHLDLIGMPPTVEELEAFLKDRDYAKLIDDLLTRPGYGERYSRHWLDVVRYADSNGYERDAAKPEVWRYRDYVICSLNEDKPFDRFLVEQLAGDELDDATAETVIATGFNRLGPWDDEPADFALDRFDQLDDIVNTTGQTFLGLTVGCARCHDHKFDPLPQTDYYSLVAIFNPLQRPQRGRTDLARYAAPPALAEKLVDRDRKIEERRAAMKRVRDEFTTAILRDGKSKLPADAQAAFLAPPDKRNNEQKKLIKDYQARLDAEIDASLPDDLRKQLAEHEAAIARLREETPDVALGYFMHEPAAMAPETRLLKRGNPATPGEVVPPAVPARIAREQPAFLEPTHFTTRRRLSLARWMVQPDNPLVARVIVNRVWQWHFGQGLVSTPNDFGLRSEPPTHPELLDWLAHWFVHDANWSFRKLHRLIMTSRTYQMTRDARADYLAEDPDNRLLWRRAPHRLEVEAIRDSMLFVSGQLDRKMFGPAMFPFVPQEALLHHADKTSIWPAFDERGASRRTIYAFIKRSLIVPFLEVLDLCDVTQSDPKRNVTTVPTQALTLYNGHFAMRQAEHFADRLLQEAGEKLGEQIRRAYLLALSREPTAAERAAMERFLKEQREELRERPDAARRALVQLCRVVFNLNEFVYPE
jgi:hypothetical protein